MGTKEKNKTKNIDHEGSKRKVKENHDSHQTSYKRAIINTIKNDDIEKRNKKIIIQKNLKELTPWRSRSKKIENSSVIKEETSDIEKEIPKKEEKEIKIEPKVLPETKTDKEENIKEDIKEVNKEMDTQKENDQPPKKKKQPPKKKKKKKKKS